MRTLEPTRKRAETALQKDGIAGEQKAGVEVRVEVEVEVRVKVELRQRFKLKRSMRYIYFLKLNRKGGIDESFKVCGCLIPPDMVTHVNGVNEV